jgi:hypothetical protein
MKELIFVIVTSSPFSNPRIAADIKPQTAAAHISIPKMLGQQAGNDAGYSIDRTHRKIEFTRDDQHRHCHRNDPEFCGLPQQIQQIVSR